jgi:subtilisin family serine protease
MQLLFIFVLGVSLSSVFAERRFDSSILTTLQEKNSANVIVSFKGSDTAKIVNELKTQKLATRANRANAVYQALKGHADATQAKVLQEISKFKSNSATEVTQLWTTNQVIIKKADRRLFEQLLAFEEISHIAEEQFFELPKRNSRHSFAANSTEQWGVVAIGAPEVWKAGYKGEGVVIANIDSGVRGTHEALKDGFRQLNGWYDPVYKTPEPVDTLGHGTHTMGTILGRSHGIGVAPEAQWIACRACPDEMCSTAELLLCGQWTVCPTDVEGNNARCDLGPHIVSNSWGFGRNQFFHNIVNLWIAIGIIPVVSSGNFGNSCGSILSPADHDNAIAVGSVDSNDQVSFFSGRGPVTATGIMKPEVAAPGVDIFSATHQSDASYELMEGTSMAAPHVSGLIALLLSRKPDLIQSQIEVLLLLGAQRIAPVNQTCGVRDDIYPNNHVGSGRINAKLSFDSINLLFP